MTLREGIVVAQAVLLSLVATLGAQFVTSVPSQPAFAVVDVLGLADGAQRTFENVGFDPKATEAERTQAIVAARAFGLQLDQAVAQLGAQCRCVLLNRAAVVSGVSAKALPDLTAALRVLLAERDVQRSTAQAGAR